MTTPGSFPAKLLLFGEYSILLGSRALSMPFPAFAASLKFPEPGPFNHRATESNRMLDRFCQHLETECPALHPVLDLDRMRKDIDTGLFLASSIPSSYGMGSSGALCAALFTRYGPAAGKEGETFPAIPPGELQRYFSTMESFFHGRSSGFDPLVSYLKAPLVLDRESIPSIITLPSFSSTGGISVFLVDSGVPCSTGKMVGGFLERFAPGGAISPDGRALCEHIEACITSFLEGDAGALVQHLSALSAFQFEQMPELVPASLHAAWKEGLETGLFALKLCGSGGGGFSLCFTNRETETRNRFSRAGIQIIEVKW